MRHGMLGCANTQSAEFKNRSKMEDKRFIVSSISKTELGTAQQGLAKGG